MFYCMCVSGMYIVDHYKCSLIVQCSIGSKNGVKSQTLLDYQMFLCTLYYGLCTSRSGYITLMECQIIEISEYRDSTVVL